MDTHIWHTDEEYQAQLALPVHMETYGLFGDVASHGTVCGIKFPPDVTSRSTGDPTEVTCEACQAGL